MTDQLFGDVVTGDDVENAALDTLKLWQRDYLGFMSRRTGRPLPLIRSWAATDDVDKWPEQSIPSCLVICTGLAGEPARAGDGIYRAPWGLGFAVVCMANDRVAANRLARDYVAAFRLLLLQQASLGGIADGIAWTDEQYDPLPARRSRQLAAGQATFVVDVRDVASSRTGPLTPSPIPAEPRPDDPIATSVEVEVQPEGE